METKKRIVARFFKATMGKEPVRIWLKQQSKEDKKSIGRAFPKTSPARG
jgi:hypothetical protein